MKYRDIRIVERRRSEKGTPRVDQRTADYDEIKKYQENTANELLKYEDLAGTKDRGGRIYPPIEDLYVSYTGIEKIGVNPRSGYDTPLGVYSYPLAHVIKKIKNTGRASAVEYMGDLPYVWVFTPKNPSAGIDIARYTEQQYKRDLAKLRQYMTSQGLTAEEYAKIESEASSSAYSYDPDQASEFISKLWNVTRVMGVELAKRKKMNTIKVDFDKGDYVEISTDAINYLSVPQSKLPEKIVAKVLKIVYESEYDDADPYAEVSLIGIPDYRQSVSIPLRYLKKTETPKNLSKQDTIHMGDTVKVTNPKHIHYGETGKIIYFTKSSVEIELPNGQQIYNISYNDIDLYDPNKPEAVKPTGLKFDVGDDVNATNPKGKKNYVVVAIDDTGVTIQPKTGGAAFKRSFDIFYKANPDLAPNIPTAPVDDNEVDKDFEPLDDTPPAPQSNWQGKIKDLMAKGKQTGVIKYHELNAALPSDVTAEQVEDVIAMAAEMGISIEESADRNAVGFITEWQKGRNRPAPKKTVEWNRIMRILGYEYTTDSRGAGVIHSNEPFQAVFYSGKYITPIEKIYNSESKKENERPYRPSEIGPGKNYDRVAFERWFKKNFSTQSAWDYQDGTLEFKSAKLQLALLKRNNEWAKKLVSLSNETKAAIRNNLDDLIKNPKSDISKIMNAAESVAYLDIDYDFKKMKMWFTKDANLAKYYLQTFAGEDRRFPEAEDALASDSETASWYAINVLQERFKKGEAAIAKNPRNAIRYAKYFKVRVPEIESTVKKDPARAAQYAIEVLNEPWPEAESLIMTDRDSYFKYRTAFPLFKSSEDVKTGTKIMYDKSGELVLAKIAKDGYFDRYGSEGIEIKDINNNGYSGTINAAAAMPVVKSRNGFTLGDMVKISTTDKSEYMLIGDDIFSGSYTVADSNGNATEVLKTDVILANPKLYEVPEDGYMAGDLVKVVKPGSQHEGKILTVIQTSHNEITVRNKFGGYSYFTDADLRHATYDDIRRQYD